ncbi:hypothetical protein A3Q56_04722 [Intoshia linei]|uniref:Uncharacterized protein n=1 Tax=Intoshia linei TaxID=1819745 RepID=A0A177AZT1_9BILA|nr:hypothetical protein A3Q56_04722 [Intoshia linei]
MARHLWYLSEELVGLSLFDDEVMASVKDRMANNILHTMAEEVPTKKVTVSLENINSMTLSTFANSNTKLLLKKLKISDNFLTIYYYYL